MATTLGLPRLVSTRGGCSRDHPGRSLSALRLAAPPPPAAVHAALAGLASSSGSFAGASVEARSTRGSGHMRLGHIRPPRALSASTAKWAGDTPPEIVILGGGFGGLYTALRLDSLDWPEGSKPRVTLVDQGERFLFKPLMYELLNGEMKEWEVAPPISEILAPTSVRFVQAQASLVVPADEESGGAGGGVQLADGQELPYDYLVLALGAKTVMDAAPGAREHAMPFSTLEDATRLNAALDALEARGQGAQVVVVGGGYAGVEMASVLGERLSGRGSVQIVTPAKRIMEGANDGQREASERALRERGVEIVAESRVSSVAGDEEGGDGKTVRVSVAGAGERAIACDLVIWTAGQRPALEEGALAASFPTSERGELLTEPTLRVRGSRRVFAVGDATAGREKGEPLPATAQVALQQADFCAWNLWCDLNGRAMLPFRYQHLGSLMTLGRADAALALPVGGLTLDGPLGQLARKAVYLYRQPTLEHRLKVGASWLARPFFQAIGQEEPELEKAMGTILDAARRL